MNEGKVGIYLKYGALMDDTTGPGMHTMAPFVTEVRENQWFQERNHPSFLPLN